MRRDHALEILSDHKDELYEMFGVTSIAIFGSTARDEATPGSDVDTLIEIERPASLFTISRVNRYLEDILDAKVDLVTPGGLRSPIRERIYQDLIYAGSQNGHIRRPTMPTSNEREWRFRLNDIQDSAEKILRYVHGMDFDTFIQDELTIDAVIRNFEIIGEAARYIPDEFRASHPHIDWQNMADMRNRLIHGYSDLSMDIVWNTIVNHLPPLLSDIRETLKVPPP